MHGAGCVRQWFRTAGPLGERCYKLKYTLTYKLEAVNMYQNMSSNSNQKP